ncbi:hypothetical protein [Nocardia wallacei]|uniref:Uncharacterized protein n=1 Tax=Nocardia wallacei TaxID=480035 RepID=A0A7G1KSE2_9NOCA|nr:hypothetical protein [Nocardia wallacei]BCK58155.1 hypothetical protein NWFMUON74_59270 [Nocardia wallacei]
MAILTDDAMNFTLETEARLKSLLDGNGLVDASHHAVAEADNKFEG